MRNRALCLVGLIISSLQFDFESVPWGEDSEPLMVTLQAMVTSNLALPSSAKKESSAKNAKKKTLDEKMATLNNPLTERIK